MREKKRNLGKEQIQKDCLMVTQLKKLLVLLILDVIASKVANFIEKTTGHKINIGEK